MSFEREQQEQQRVNDEYCEDHRRFCGENRDPDTFDCEECKGADTCRFNPLK